MQLLVANELPPHSHCTLDDLAAVGPRLLIRQAETTKPAYLAANL